MGYEKTTETVETNTDDLRNEKWDATRTHHTKDEGGKEAVGAGAGALGGAAVGMAVGGPPGAVIGGAIGAVGGAVAGESAEGGEEAGAGTGGLAGGLAGAAIGGAVAGPPGAVVGGAVGAAGGAGAGDKAEEEAEGTETVRRTETTERPYSAFPRKRLGRFRQLDRPRPRNRAAVGSLCPPFRRPVAAPESRDAGACGRKRRPILVPRAHATSCPGESARNGRFRHLWHAPRESSMDSSSEQVIHVGHARPTRIPQAGCGARFRCASALAAAGSRRCR
jgi:hypothetical protein